MNQPRRKKSNALTPAQRRNIFRLQSTLGIDDDVRRAIIERVTGKTSLTQLTRQDGIRVIHELMLLAGEAPPERPGRIPSSENSGRDARAPGVRRDPESAPSLEQLAMLTGLLSDMGATARQRADWIQRQLGYQFPRTVREAQACIEAAKKMAEKGYKFGKTVGSRE